MITQHSLIPVRITIITSFLTLMSRRVGRAERLGANVATRRLTVRVHFFRLAARARIVGSRIVDGVVGNTHGR